MMKKLRDLAGYAGMENPPTFHTVRSLANSLAKKVEESKAAIQKNNAHKSVDTQFLHLKFTQNPTGNVPFTRFQPCVSEQA